jgi:hypothetical protein
MTLCKSLRLSGTVTATLIGLTLSSVVNVFSEILCLMQGEYGADALSGRVREDTVKCL